MEKEFQAICANRTLEIVELPPHKKSIGNKWVYSVKLSLDGSIERIKARLAIRSDTQKAGIYYFEAFSPVIKMTAIQKMAAAIKRGWEMHKLDVNNAFSHGYLDENVCEITSCAGTPSY